MTTKLDVDYAIEIDFKKQTQNPERIFFAVGQLIKSFQLIDDYLIESIDSKIKPILLLEDIESGSIRAWLKNIIKSVDDDAIKNLEWKQAVGAYLVKGKYAIINFLEDKVTITDRRQLMDLEGELIEMARETDVLTIPSYQPIKRNQLISGLQSISESLNSLNKDDKAYYVTRENQKKPFNLFFPFFIQIQQGLLNLKIKL